MQIALIGDCHSARIYQSHLRAGSKVDFKVFSYGGLKAWDIDFNSLNDLGYVDVENESTSLTFSDIKDEGVVMIWLGYVDSKTHLPKYQNASICAEQLVRKAVDYFKNATLIFIDPLPQFEETIMRYDGEHHYYDYDERLTQDHIFRNNLRKWAGKLGNHHIISQSEIFDALGITSLNLSHTQSLSDHPQDRLKDYLSDLLYELFINKALKLLPASDPYIPTKNG